MVCVLVCCDSKARKEDFNILKSSLSTYKWAKKVTVYDYNGMMIIIIIIIIISSSSSSNSTIIIISMLLFIIMVILIISIIVSYCIRHYCLKGARTSGPRSAHANQLRLIGCCYGK